MNIIIDTHIFLWLAANPEKINKEHMQYIEDLNNTIYLSSMSIAEIMIKKSIGNLNFEADILAILEEMGIEVLDFDAQSAIMLGQLPMHHKDPFDRMIISQSIINNYKIISVDSKFKMYDCELL